MTLPSEFGRDVVGLLWARAMGCCERCGRSLVRAARGRGWSAHHRQPRGMGGSPDEALGRPANGLLLCGSGVDGCHGDVESDRATSVLVGLLVPMGEQPADVPVTLFLFGRVLLLDNGDVGDP